MARRWLEPESAADLGRLDPEAIARVKAEAWPDAANADELHDALVWLGFLTEAEVAGERRLAATGWPSSPARSARRSIGCAGATLWIAAERLSLFRCAVARLRDASRPIAAPAGYDKALSSDDALLEILRGRLEGLGPVTAAALAAPLGLDDRDAALATLEVRRLRHARPLLGRGGRARMVRAPPAGAHPSLHDQAAARRDRARRGARLPALPVPLAARRAGVAHGGREGARRRHRRSSKASARPPVRGRARSCRRASRTTRRAGSMRDASPARRPGRACARAVAAATASGGAGPVRTTPITLSPRRNVGPLALAVARR